MALSDDDRREIQKGLAEASRALHRPDGPADLARPADHHEPRHSDEGPGGQEKAAADRRRCRWCRGSWPCQGELFATRVLGRGVED